MLDTYKQKRLAKQLAPIIKRCKEIDKIFDTDLEISQAKVLGIELADLFIEVVQICGKYGFRKSKMYTQVCNGLKERLKATKDEDLLSDSVNYLLSNFNSLIVTMG
ncbi:hypothetical protein LCGC14_1816080, partial [marine sediment metagenome]